MLTQVQKERLYKQQYRLVGNHSAVKICHWNKEMMRNKNRPCYKQHFYDVHTINCLEMSPAITCNQRCLHCWRDTSVFSTKWEGETDDPKEIIKGCIEGRTQLLMGFKGLEGADLKNFDSYLIPDHAAISLTGEPCMYPKLHLLIDSFFDDFNFRTVFLVTSGTVPGMIKKIGTESKNFPTNLYLSLEAYDEKSHKDFNIPVIKNSWEKVNESLQYLSKVRDKTRTILRITAVKEFNMDKAKEFVKYIKMMNPVFIEVKGYAHIGYSQRRLEKANMPYWDEVQAFAKEIAELTGYKITAEDEPSDVVQLGKD
jgi:tRNA wybutosine-synthesizing protein 1